MVLPYCLSLTSKSKSKSNPNPKGDEASSVQTSPALNANVARQEYTLAVLSNSYNEIWSTIQFDQGDDDDGSGSGSFHRVLRPNRECVEDALRLARPSALTRLVSAYFEHSENTAQLCLRLNRSLLRARSLYAPLHDLLDLLSAAPFDADPQLLQSLSLTQPQCDLACQVFQQFDALENPFPSPDSLSFDHICTSFSELKLQLDRRLQKSRSSIRRLLLCRDPIAVSALSAARAFACLLAGPSCPALPIHLRGKEVARAQMQQLDAAARGSFVLDNDLRTISCLVSHLHSAINDDKDLVRVALEGGPERHLIQEVLKQLRKNNANFLYQLKDIEERICLCLNTVNRARNLLLHHVYRHQTCIVSSPIYSLCWLFFFSLSFDILSFICCIFISLPAVLIGERRERQREETISDSVSPRYH